MHSTGERIQMHLSVDGQACGCQAARQPLVSMHSMRAGAPFEVLLFAISERNPSKTFLLCSTSICRCAPAMCGVIALRGM